MAPDQQAALFNSFVTSAGDTLLDIKHSLAGAGFTPAEQGVLLDAAERYLQAWALRGGQS